MKHISLKPLLFSIFMLFGQGLLAQRMVVGKVIDAANGEPLPGASVQVKGTNVGATTAGDGTYKLGVPAGAEAIVFTYLGYEKQEIGLNDVNVINISMTGSTKVVSETVVIGSRSSTRTQLTSAVPVDIIPIASVTNEVGQVDLNQILTYIAPSFQSARQTISDGTDHIDPAQLRGLGPDQVLVLVNGKRRHQSALVNVNGTINRGTVGTDLAAVPASAIDRVEILRDGAAAQYGSDAIAGVINIILKKKTGVLDGSVSYGQHLTEYAKNEALFRLGKTSDALKTANDGQTVQAGLNYGFKLGSRGFLNLTGEYIQRGATNRAGTYTGTIYSAKDDSILTAKNLARDFFDMRIGQSEIKGGGAMFNLDYGLKGDWDFYAFGGYNTKKGNATGFYRYPSAINTNAKIYAPNVLAIYPNGFLPAINSDVQDLSVAAGLRGKINGWLVDFSNTFGQNTFDFTIDRSVNYSQAKTLPNNLQTSFDAGGLDFLQNTINVDASRKLYNILNGLNLAFGGEHRIDIFGIREGEEASWKNYDIPSGAAAGAQVFSGFLPENRGNNSRNCFGLYADAEQDFNEAFMVAAAVRFENFSDFGSTVNGKLASRYRFGDVLTLRASASTGFRAPSMQQRFYAKTNTLFVSQPGGGLAPVESGTFTNSSKAAKILGIPSLKQETSLNFSAGFTARIVDGLEVTVDAYQIDIDDRIVLTNNFSDGGDSTLKAQLAAANAGQANFFTNAVDTRSRGIEAVIAYTKKFGGNQEFRFVAAGTLLDNTVKKDATGKAIIHASEILERTGQIGKYFNREDQSRIEVASPKHKISATINYKIGKFGLMLRGVNFGPVKYLDPTIDPTKPDKFPKNAFNSDALETLDQVFSGKTVFDMSLSFKIINGLGLTVGVNNLLDTYQDLHTHSGNMSSGRFIYSRRVQQMGFNGRYVFGRLKFDF